MQTKVQKWGNSIGLRIPKLFAKEIAIEEGSAVDLSVANGQLVIRPLRQERFELRALLAEVSDENLHAEISTGEPQGRESW
jgi:antitoxin MazE